MKLLGQLVAAGFRNDELAQALQEVPPSFEGEPCLT
jgi:hypothetical protein